MLNVRNVMRSLEFKLKRYVTHGNETSNWVVLLPSEVLKEDKDGNITQISTGLLPHMLKQNTGFLGTFLYIDEVINVESVKRYFEPSVILWPDDHGRIHTTSFGGKHPILYNSSKEFW